MDTNAKTVADDAADAGAGAAQAPSVWDDRRLRLWHALGLGPAWRDPRRHFGSPLDAPASLAPASPAPLDWPGLAAAVAACTRCGLCEGRRQAVLEAGRRTSHWMVVGEAPGAEEDARGEPFVGQAGKLLDNMLAAIGVSRTADGPGGAYIANVLKCRPPSNRNPGPEEIAKCEPYLFRQIELVRPRLLLAMGKFAAHSLLGTDAPVGSLRGRVHPGTPASGGVPVVVTWHPAYLLRTPAEKARAWADLCLARDAFEALPAA